MAVVSLADASAQLSQLVEAAATTHERFEITRDGQRAAVLLGADDYDALREAIAVLSDSELLAAHIAGLRALHDGDVVDEQGLAAAMRQAGRRP